MGVLARPWRANGVIRGGIQLRREEGLHKVRRADRLKPHTRRGHVDCRDHDAGEDEHVARRSAIDLVEDERGDR